MKSLMTITALALLAGCAGMRTSGGSSDEMKTPTPQEQYYDPRSPYFYGQG